MKQSKREDTNHMTYTEAAAYFRITKQTFYLWVRKKILPPADKEGGLWKKSTIMKHKHLRPAYAKNDPRLISRDELCVLMGIASSTLQKRVANKQMTKPVIRGYWLRKDIVSHIKKEKHIKASNDGTIGALGIARRLGITSNYVYKLVKKGLLPNPVSPGRWVESDIPVSLVI